MASSDQKVRFHPGRGVHESYFSNGFLGSCFRRRSLHTTDSILIAFPHVEGDLLTTVVSSQKNLQQQGIQMNLASGVNLFEFADEKIIKMKTARSS